MVELEQIGQTQEIQRYNQKKMPRYKEPSRSGRLLKNPPLVIPEELPITTMCRIFQTSKLSESADYNLIVILLTTYQRQGINRQWDVFRLKLPDPLLKLWGDLLIECRRNGFVLPRAEDGQITWRQVCCTGRVSNYGDQCTMCERQCGRREKINSGEMKRLRLLDKNFQEPKPCWYRGEVWMSG